MWFPFFFFCKLPIATRNNDELSLDFTKRNKLKNTVVEILAPIQKYISGLGSASLNVVWVSAL